MEVKEEPGSGVTVKGEEAPESFRLAPRIENPSHVSAPTMPQPVPSLPFATAAASSPSPAPAPAPVCAPGPVAAPAPAPGPAPMPIGMATPGMEVKKKRGRPRKYGPDGSVALALSPMPISSSIPLTGDFSAWKRGRARPLDTVKKTQKFEFESPGNVLGERLSYYVGANFTPHVITVNAGEDVTMKIMSFSQQGSRAICILSANGTISNVTLRQPTSSGGTLTYEGRFEILSLSGSFMPTENGGTKSRSGGMSVSLAGPDGRVVGGGLAGLLVAAGPVQVVVGSFLPGHQQEQKAKKQRTEYTTTVTPSIVNPMSADDMKGSFGGMKPIVAPSFSFHADSMASRNPMQDVRNSSDNNGSVREEEPKVPGQSNCEVSC